MKETLDFDRMLAFARELIRIPGAPGAEGDVAARVKQEMETLGFDDVWTDEVGNVIGRVRGHARTPAVMLNSHLDVVDVGDPATWEHGPYSGDVADGFLHGRGAMDIKGPLAIQTHAAAAFVQARPASDVYVGHTVLEERGGWGMEHLLNAGEVKPDVVILGEATAGDICVGHRGRAELIVELQGRAGHASAPDRALNPITLLPVIVPALEQFSASLGSDDVLGPSTAAPTTIETLPRSRNVIPDRIRIVIDWRVLPGLSRDDAVAQLTSAIAAALPDPAPFAVDVFFATERQRTWTGREKDRPMFTPGYRLDPQHAVVRAAAAAVSEHMGRTPRVRPWTFATDGGHSCGVHGIPTLGFAPGEERFAHTNRERLALDEAERTFHTYPSLIRAVRDAAAS